jgi:hypothetical protein
VGAFEMVRQIHEHADGGDRILEGPGFVPHLYRKPQAAHADFVDAQFSKITFILLIMQPMSRQSIYRSTDTCSTTVFWHRTTLTGMGELANSAFRISRQTDGQPSLLTGRCPRV